MARRRGSAHPARALFTAMREAGPLPVAAPATAADYLAERRASLDRRLADVSTKAAADALEDVRIKGDDMEDQPASRRSRPRRPRT